MADFEKIDRNLKRLFQANAPDEHVQTYLESEGVTAQDVETWKSKSAQVYQPSPAMQPGAVMRPGEGRSRRKPAPAVKRQTPSVTGPGPTMPPAVVLPEQMGVPQQAPPPRMTPQPPPQQSAPPPTMPPTAPTQPAADNGSGFIDDYILGPAQAVGGAVAGAGQAVYDAVKGKQDPRFKDTPTLQENSGMAMDGFAEMTAVSDDALADVWAKTLGDRYLGTFKDANGYPVIRFRGKDGSVQFGYVNKPGLDGQDINRGISQAIPYLVGGGVAGRALKSLGVGANVAGQALAAGTTSIAQDAGAQSIGSEQGVDITRAGIAGALGGGGELIGRVAIPFVMKYRSSNIINEDAMGNITLNAKGKRLAQREGLNPEMVIPRSAVSKELKQNLAVANDPAEALIKHQTDQFGIRTTSGQRSKNPMELQLEKDLRIDTMGPEAGKKMRSFDTEQAADIRRAALGMDGAPLPPPPPEAAHLAPKSVGPVINTKRGADVGRDELGESVRRGFQGAIDNAKKMEKAAWSKVHNVSPKAGAFEALPKIISRKMKTARIDADLHPAASKMSKDLQAYADGNAGINPEAPEILGQQAIRYVDEMRRNLLDTMNAAKDTTDKKLAGRLYGAYLDWIDDAAQKQLITGGPQAALAMRDARGATKQFMSILKPKGAQGKTATATLEKVKDAQSGEEALKALLGASGPQADLPAGAIKSIRQYKAATHKLAGKDGIDAWNDLRLAHWTRQVARKDGELHTPQMIVKNIRHLKKNQPSLYKTLYTPDERKLIDEFEGAVNQANWKPHDINPSGTGSVQRSAMRGLVQDQAAFYAQATRAQGTMRGDKWKLIQSRIWRTIAKYIKMTEKPAGTITVNRALNQDVMRRRVPAIGGYPASLAPQVDKE